MRYPQDHNTNVDQMGTSMRQTRLHKLTSKQIQHSKDGKLSDGGGLQLRTRGTNRVWIFRYSFNGKSREMGLGPVDVKEARTRAAQAREDLAAGIDPLDSPVTTVAAPVAGLTFRAAMDRYLGMRSAEWSNSKHAKQWPSSLNTYAKPLMRMPVGDISTRHIADCLSPIWQSKQETASRVRQRIERILSASIALGDRDGPNPAVWRDNLELVLGKQKRPVKHHAAVPVDQAPAAFADLWQRRHTGVGAMGAVLIALTVLRSGEVRHMQWSDLDGDVLEIPADRMKARKSHRVPVGGPLRDVLDGLPKWSGTPLVLPSARGVVMSDMTIAAAMKRAGWGAYTPHGWRSTFSDWAHGEGWNHRWIEDALAHTIGSNVERAYRRSDYLTQRQLLMDAWHNCLFSNVPAT